MSEVAPGLRGATESAWTVSVVREIGRRVDQYRASSRVSSTLDTMTAVLAGWWSASVTERRTRRGQRSLARMSRGSRVVATVEAVGRAVMQQSGRAIEGARVVELGHWTERAVRSSWLFRWLTAEPEPEVIVIDLRETLSVGPILALFDTLIRRLVPASHRSAVVGTGESIHEFLKEAPIRAASIVLGIVVLTNLIATFAVGDPSQAGVVARVVLLGLAALGTRVTTSWDELIDTKAVRLVIAALEPPEPPDDRLE